jgi:peptidoglycan/LPS O-acetylase OafA/YrhL
MKNEIKEIKMLSFFGDISYSLYLTHIAITMYLDKFGANIPIYNQWVGMSRLILLFIITITTAYFLQCSRKAIYQIIKIYNIM